MERGWEGVGGWVSGCSVDLRIRYSFSNGRSDRIETTDCVSREHQIACWLPRYTVLEPVLMLICECW